MTNQSTETGVRMRRCAGVLLCVAIASCSRGGSESGGFGQQDDLIPAVEIVEVMQGSLPLEERLAGSVRARNQTEIFADASGTIERVFVDDGDRVKAGDRLVQLQARDFQERVSQASSGLRVAEARVRQAEANVARMRANLSRAQQIVDRQLGTQAELDAAIADAGSAEADLDLMLAQRDQAASVLQEREAELADTLVRAPIDGVVGARNAEVGQQTSASVPLFVIGDVDRMRVSVTLTQRMLGYIGTGTSVRVYSDTDPDTFIEASISRISPYLHDVTHTTDAEINIDRHGGMLRPGMFVTVDVLYGESEQAALVPNSALYRHPRDGRQGVYVAALGDAQHDFAGSGETPGPTSPVTVSFTPVEVVAPGRTSSGIRGVSEGDWVVTLGHDLLANADMQQAIVRPTSWSHILELQQLESRDLLQIIEQKQQQNEAAGRGAN